MFGRIIIAAALAAALAGGATTQAGAQQLANPGQPAATPSGWVFNVAPYVWMPTLSTSLKFNVPAAPGSTVTADSNVGFGDLLSHMNSAVMLAADAQYGPFSLLTDFVYLNLGATSAHFNSIKFFNQNPLPITRSSRLFTGLNVNGGIWTLAGGYTVASGDWGRLDVIAGLRYLPLNARLNYNLSVMVSDPSGSGKTFGGAGGSVSGSVDIWNGIGGVRGRIRLGDKGLFIPYYLDAGAGGSQFTWQIASGLGYHMHWGDVSLTYRYLTFEQNKDAVFQRMTVYGPMIMVNFTF
ncbi:MAG: hypothetical protein P4M09_14825 [Devosia sp.]|nr:hypothetical protein [Devosia sp.]